MTAHEALAIATAAIKKHRDKIHGQDYDYASDPSYAQEAELYSVLSVLQEAARAEQVECALAVSDKLFLERHGSYLVVTTRPSHDGINNQPIYENLFIEPSEGSLGIGVFLRGTEPCRILVTRNT